MGLSPAASGSPSLRSFRPDASLSRRPSIEDVPENEPGPSTPQRSSRTSSSGAHSRATSRPPSPPPSSPGEVRGRRTARFSLSSVSSVLMDAVRSKSPKKHGFFDRTEEEEKANSRRGRPKEKGKSVETPNASLVRTRQSVDRLASKFGDALKLEHEETGVGDGWKEFKKGKYIYLLFSPPSNISWATRNLYIPNIFLDTRKFTCYSSMRLRISDLAPKGYGSSPRRF